MDNSLSKGNRIAGWVLSGFITASLVLSSIAKFFAPEMQANFENWGLGDWRILIAIGEMVSAILFLIPRTSRVGLLLLSAYFGGAIMIHMSHAESFLVPAIILVFVWVTGLVRDPSRYGFSGK